MPKISVIMGAYNCEKSLARCIESIISQTLSNWEFIICDDCSTDDTYKILMEYQNKDSRISILKNKKNIRLAASLNRCLCHATGEYIARMDADDECTNERFFQQACFLDAHSEYDVVGSNLIVFDESGDKTVRRTIEYPTGRDLKYGPPFAHPTIMMRKYVYDHLNGYTISKETMRSEDLDLWFRFYKNNFEGYNLQQNLYRYHESSSDFKKRTLISAYMATKVFIRGYFLLGFSKRDYIYALKPIVSACLPKRIMIGYHNKR